MELKQITLPCVTLNGTSANMLFEGYSDARDAIITAMDKMNAMEFHSRDYMQQPNGAEAWKKAQAEHRDRFERLRSVAAELFAIMEHVSQFRKD